VSADAIIVGVGVEPSVDLAVRGGLDVNDGILVDEYFSSSDERVYAVGDVARVFHVGLGRHIRMEQWRSAEEQGRKVAASILGRAEPYHAIPWMWSDQHDLHLQATGFGFHGTEVAITGSLDERTGVVCLGTRHARVVAACGGAIGT